MSQDILINEESFTRTKKKLKKLLEEKGLNVSLCEASEILSKSLGFKNTFELQRSVFSNIEKISNSPLHETKQCLPKSSKETIITNTHLKPYTDNQQGWIDLKPYKKEISIIKRADLSQISSLGLSYENIKGNIMVYGLKTSGKEQLVKDIISIFDKGYDNYTSLILENPTVNMFHVLNDGRVINEKDVSLMPTFKKGDDKPSYDKTLNRPIKKLFYDKAVSTYDLKKNNAKGQYNIFEIDEENIPKDKILTLKNKKDSDYNIHFFIHVIVQNGFQSIEVYNFLDGMKFMLK